MIDRTHLGAARPVFDESDIAVIGAGIAEVLRSGRLILGDRAASLEQAVAARVGREHAVALSSCTAALQIALRHARVSGREVIVPTNTFVATANAARYAGARVVFADISPSDYCIDAEDAIRRITERTAAVVVVHVAGFISAATMALRAECVRRGVALVEDCAHAHGALFAGREAGSFGDAGCFSFYATKILTSGTGGMLVTDDGELAALARSVRHHGQGSSLEEIVRDGDDWLLDEVRAVIAHRQLARLDDFLARRRALAAMYGSLLRGDRRVELPVVPAGCEPAYYKYPVLLRQGVDRDRVRRRLLEEHDIEAGALYSPPCHLMPVFAGLPGAGRGSLPIAEQVLPRQLTLPMHAGLASGDVERVVGALDHVLRGELA